MAEEDNTEQNEETKYEYMHLFELKYADWSSKHESTQNEDLTLSNCDAGNFNKCPHVQRIIHAIKYYESRVSVFTDKATNIPESEYNEIFNSFFLDIYDMFIPDMEHMIKSHDQERGKIFKSMIDQHDDIPICAAGNLITLSIF